MDKKITITGSNKEYNSLFIATIYAEAKRVTDLLDDSDSDYRVLLNGIEIDTSDIEYDDLDLQIALEIMGLDDEEINTILDF